MSDKFITPSYHVKEIKMALINCKECGKRFSDLAISCPKCAAPTAYSTDKFSDVHNQDIETPPISFDLLQSETCNKIMDYYWGLHSEIDRLGGKIPEYPEFKEEEIVRAIITRMVQFKRMFLTISHFDGKPQIQFIPSNCWIMDSESIAKMIGDSSGPRKELLPDIIQAAVNRLANKR